MNGFAALDIPPCRRYVVVKATAGFAVCRLILKLLLFYSCLDFTQNLGKTPQHGTIVKPPSGYWQQVPQVSIAQTYLKLMNRFAEQFGLTPASRSRIIAADSSTDTQDEMEALLEGSS